MVELEKKAKSDDSEAWMATFADLATLLLTFFVLLLSFANLDIVKFREMMGSVQDAFGYQTVAVGNWNPTELSPNPKISDPSQAAAGQGGVDPEMLEDIEKMISENDLEKTVETVPSQRGVIIRVNDSLMFKAGSDKLEVPSYAFLDGMIALMTKFDYEVQIEGHTDNTPIKTARFPSNWELSTARAIAAMRYLVDVGGIDPGRFSAAGYADMRPLVPGNAPKARGKNRRVEFVCLNHTGDDPPTGDPK